MPTHHVYDRGRRVEIDGDLIATSSSAAPGKARWVEYRLYRLATHGGYVVSIVGRSAVPGETDRPSMRIAENPAAVIRALEREVRPGVWELPWTARRLLDSAVTFDAGIRTVHTRTP